VRGRARAREEAWNDVIGLGCERVIAATSHNNAL